jgi:NAD(P)-dependent dehydrogenase (short-subunit alcohol dehydrogenase family)
MSLFDMRGQVAVITGSSEGIGLACAAGMAAQGARVVISSRTAAACEARAAALNEQHGEERAIAVPCDVSDRDSLQHLVEATMDHWGRIDCVVGHASAPVEWSAWVEKVDEGALTESFAGNVTNNVGLTKLVVPIMRDQGGGSIIFTSSAAGVVALEDHLSYGIVKAALVHLARILAVQLGPLNIRVNAVAPGVIASRGLEGSDWADDELRRIGVGSTPLGRVGTPEEIAGCVVWLASPSGAFATGQVFVVDGGQTLKGMDGIHLMRNEMRDRKRASEAGQP